MEEDKYGLKEFLDLMKKNREILEQEQKACKEFLDGIDRIVKEEEEAKKN